MRPHKTLFIFMVLLVLLYGPSLFFKGPVRIAPGISVEWPDISKKYFNGETQSDKTEDKVNYVIDTLIVTGNINDTTDVEIEYGLLHDFSESGLQKGIPGERIRKDSGQLRIMYYGDSQLEGDRITVRLREELRKILPGSGPGLLSITPLVPYTRTSNVKYSDNWNKYNFLDYRDGVIDHRSLGPLFSISRFTGPGVKTAADSEAWFSLEPSRYSDSLSARYEIFRLFYGKLEDTLKINIQTGGGMEIKDTLYPSASESEYTRDLGATDYLKVIFRGKSSPDFYGFSVESSQGVVVDNIPNRGSAGLEFSLVSAENLSNLYGMIRPDIIVLHYGLNVVLSTSRNFKYYEDGIYRQLLRLKELNPGSQILLMGITDMAHLVDNELQSYSNIPLIRDAQMNAARRAGVMFWDSWQAMGGKNSVIEWNNKRPALAAEDYTHLTYAGGDTLADMLLDDILGKKVERVYDEAEFKIDTIFRTDDTISKRKEKIPYKFYAGKILNDLKYYDPGKPLLFTGEGFWVFLFITLILYSLIFSKPLLRNSYLFLFSLFFYYKSGGVFFFLLIISTLTDYLAGLIIYASRKKTVRRLFVVLSLVVNLGMLSYFKYTEFFTGIVNSVFNTNIPVIDWMAAITNFYLGTDFNIETIILPVGISFFTFQTISYTLDVYRGKTKPVRNILDFGFYVSFFPQLVAGPIVRASEFVPQLYSPFRLSKREWGHALFLIIGGLIKKIVISDLISVNFVDRVFDTPLLYSGLENLIAVYGYGLQIYCDFSGYTDIAIGIALMLGYRLPVNFNSPYKAHNITDFWRRWHISLSRWLKDYLYISLGGNRRGRIRTNINLMVTMLLGGLWHGAAWRFIIWGGLHGLGLVINKLWIKAFPARNKPGRVKRFISVFITFNFISFLWIFFRAVDTNHVYLMLRQIFFDFNPGNVFAVFTAYSQSIIIIICGYILHFLPVRVKESYRGLFIKLPLIVKIILVYLVALVLFNVQSTDIQPFIYFRF